MTETDRNARLLLQAIIADPADNAARLAFADWLEEQTDGDPVNPKMIRAGMIRHGHQRANLAIGSWSAVFPSFKGMVDRYGLEVWIDGERWRMANRVGAALRADTPRVTFVRGFARTLLVPFEAWLIWGGRIARYHPVTCVRLCGVSTEHVDREPGFNCYRIVTPIGPDYSHPFWDCHEVRRWYATPEEADAALSSYCIRWARGQEVKRA